MVVRTKRNTRIPSPALAKGQVWKMKDVHIQIMELGKRLVHYKMLRDLGQMRRTQMSRIDSMELYLKTHRAKVVKTPPAQSLPATPLTSGKLPPR
jgi:hypothetical protein